MVDAASSAQPLAVAMLFLALLLFLVSPRFRILLAGLIVVIAAAVIVSVTGAQGPPSGPHIFRSGGRAVALVGAALAALGALGVIVWGRGVPRFRMPESAPEDAE